MYVGESVQVQALLSLEKSVEELKSALTAAGAKEGSAVQVGPQMEARLTGPGFQITAVSPEKQSIASKGTTEWKWDVKATAVGKQELHLTLSALFEGTPPHAPSGRWIGRSKSRSNGANGSPDSSATTGNGCGPRSSCHWLR